MKRCRSSRFSVPAKRDGKESQLGWCPPFSVAPMRVLLKMVGKNNCKCIELGTVRRSHLVIVPGCSGVLRGKIGSSLNSDAAGMKRCRSSRFSVPAKRDGKESQPGWCPPFSVAPLSLATGRPDGSKPAVCEPDRHPAISLGFSPFSSATSAACAALRQIRRL